MQGIQRDSWKIKIIAALLALAAVILFGLLNMAAAWGTLGDVLQAYALIVVISLIALIVIIRYVYRPYLEARTKHDTEIMKYAEPIKLNDGRTVIVEGVSGHRLITRIPDQFTAPPSDGDGKRSETIITPQYLRAVRLLRATAEAAKYGPDQAQIMTADDAQFLGVFGGEGRPRDRWQEAVDWLKDHCGILPSNKGVLCPDGVTVGMVLYRIDNFEAYSKIPPLRAGG